MARSEHSTGEALLDVLPQPWIVISARTQLDHRMQMLRQHHRSQNQVRNPTRRITPRLFQRIDLPHQQIATPVTQRHSEEVRAASNAVTSIVDHRSSVAMRRSSTRRTTRKRTTHRLVIHRSPGKRSAPGAS
ncbi:hypothetical protein D3C81_1579730 [compost metagenome]